MDKVTVRPIMHPDRPIEVRPDEAAVLRAQGLLAEDKPKAPRAPKTAAKANAAAQTPTPTPDTTEGNTPS